MSEQTPAEGQATNQPNVTSEVKTTPSSSNSEGFSSNDVKEMASALSEDLFGKPVTDDKKDEESSENDESSTSDEGDLEDSGKKPLESDSKESTDKKEDDESETEESSETPAPKTWRNDAVSEWNKLPPVVKAEIIKREEDFHNGIALYRENAEVGRKMLDVYAPYSELLASQNVDPYHLAAGLLNAHVTLSLKSTPQATKEQMFLKMAADYGIDLNTLDPTYQHQEDPSVLELKTELQTIKSQILETTKSNIRTEIEKFASDPANIYFDDVANDMTLLIRAGAKTLKEAYDKAILLNPVVRVKEEARIAKEAKDKAEAERQQKVLEAKAKKAANVNSSHKQAHSNTQKDLSKLDETLSAAYDKLMSKHS